MTPEKALSSGYIGNLSFILNNFETEVFFQIADSVAKTYTFRDYSYVRRRLRNNIELWSPIVRQLRP